MIELTNELLRLTQIENRREKHDILLPYDVSDTINEVISNYKLIHSNLKITYKHYANHDQ